MNNSFFVLLSLAVGCCFPLMASSNGVLARELGSPFMATLAIFQLGSALLLILLVLSGTALPSMSKFASINWKVWAGGCIVILNLVTFTIVPGKIGITNMIVLFIAGQLIASVVAEHFGWLQFKVHGINWQRLVGVACLVTGVVLVKKF